jgi:4-hydroxy-4-methyl-2-oxoglutarate aldolase
VVEIPEEVRRRLMGLIPLDRIATIQIPRPSAEVLARYKALEDPTPLIADALDALGLNGIVGASVLRPVNPGRAIVGPAVTLRYAPERVQPAHGFAQNMRPGLADRDAYAVAEPGDVAVFDAGGREVSCMGGLSTTVAHNRGMAGVVVWGGVRDVATMRHFDFPVWSAHVTPRSGKFRLEAVELNGVVDCADVQVRPGDLVVADDTGVVVIPSDRVEEVLALAEAAAALEVQVVDLLARNADLAELTRALPPDRW